MIIIIILIEFLILTCKTIRVSATIVPVLWNYLLMVNSHQYFYIKRKFTY